MIILRKPFTLGLVKLHIEAVLKRAGKMRSMLEYKRTPGRSLRAAGILQRSVDGDNQKEFDLLVYLWNMWEVCFREI